MTVQALFVKNNRNTQTRIIQKEFLNGIGQFRRLPRVASACGIAGSTNLAKPMTLAKRGLGLLQIEFAVGIDKRFRFLLPHAHHLCGFFVERHAREEILHSLFRGNSRIFICRQPRSFCRNCRPSRTSRLALREAIDVLMIFEG